MSEISDLFQQLKLERYTDRFEDEGFDTLKSLKHISQEDLDDMGVKKGHARIIMAEAKKAKGGKKSRKMDDAADAAPPPPPSGAFGGSSSEDSEEDILISPSKSAKASKASKAAADEDSDEYFDDRAEDPAPAKKKKKQKKKQKKKDKVEESESEEEEEKAQKKKKKKEKKKKKKSKQQVEEPPPALPSAIDKPRKKYTMRGRVDSKVGADDEAQARPDAVLKTVKQEKAKYKASQRPKKLPGPLTMIDKTVHAIFKTKVTPSQKHRRGMNRAGLPTKYHEDKAPEMTDGYIPEMSKCRVCRKSGLRSKMIREDCRFHDGQINDWDRWTCCGVQVDMERYPGCRMAEHELPSI